MMDRETIERSPTPGAACVGGSPSPFRMKFPFLSSVALSAMMAASPASTMVLPGHNFLVNPGFETGNLSGWSTGGKHGGIGVSLDGVKLPVTSALPETQPTLYIQSWQNVRSGSHAAYAITAGDNQPVFREFASFWQMVSTPSALYRIGFQMTTDNDIGGFGIAAALDDRRLAIFVDDTYQPLLVPRFSNAPLSRNFVGGTSPEAFVDFAVELPLTSGMHKIEFRLSGSGTSRAGISMDDTYVTAIPEPSLVSLGGTALALLLRRRMRDSRPPIHCGRC